MSAGTARAMTATPNTFQVVAGSASSSRPSLTTKLDELFNASSSEADYGSCLLDLMVGLSDAKAGSIVEQQGEAVALWARCGGAQPAELRVITSAAAVGYAHVAPALAPARAGSAGLIIVPLAPRTGQAAAAILELGAERAPFALALALERLELLSAVHRGHIAHHGRADEHAALMQRLVGAGSSAQRLQGFADGASERLGGAPLAVARVYGWRIGQLRLAKQSTVAGTSAVASAVRIAVGQRLDGKAGASGDGWLVAVARDGQRVVGALAVQRPTDAATSDLLAHRLDRLAEAAAPYFDASARASTMAERWVHLSADPKRRQYALAVAGGIALMLVCPMPDRVAAPFRLEAIEHRTVTAPYDGQLETVLVKANDSVTSGQTVLAKLATRELDLTLASNEAIRASALTERAIAQNAQKPAEARAAELKAMKAEAEIAITKFRKGLAEVKSPIDGTVVKADVQRQAGSVVSRGQVLFEISDPRALAVDILVPDEEIGRIVVGQAGVLSPAAEPGASYGFKIDRVHPASEMVGTRTVFRVRATLDGAAPSRLKTGMEGAARVHTGYAPFGWLMIRDVVNAVRRWLWI